MDTILDALQEGRLFELPENDKAHALQFLAHIIEAFPETAAGTDVVGLVMKREDATGTAIGKGWACPHARVPYDEDLMCVMGWSPKGIDYGASDGKSITLVVMYLVPNNQRNHYLREISMLAKALETYPRLEKLSEVRNLDDVRLYILDLIEATKGAVGPVARAKMIRLQTKPALEAFPCRDLSNLVVEPITLIAGPGMKHVVLAQNYGLVEWLDTASGLIEKIEADGVYQDAGWRILRRGSVNYQGGRVAYDCLAIRMILNNSIQPK
ncbi:MAG: PTS sugar transporter subunit IIA [Candidatus Aminicenantes bacterium]|nr:PTS sugar transporter subunit IIA [Candidatus Aminicenantes bacterium]